ncbi:MAG: asparaginase [Microthrixaceae bacterium]
MSVTLIATGGTIASTRGDDGMVTTTLAAAELLSLAGVDDLEVELVDLSVPGSWNLTTELVAAVAGEVRAALGRGSRGVVVTHGTDVLEETAWACELLVGDAADRGAVVLTCAMRHASEFGGDGPRNLTDALTVAADPVAAGRGALVCANGELHHARWVTKTHATALSTFASPGRGPVGEVGERGVRIVAPSPPRPPAVGTRLEAAVPVVVSHWDADPDLLDWHLSRGARGVVLQGGGAGNVNGNLVEGVARAIAAGVPVVGTTRCQMGEVTPIYGGLGGFASLHAMGVIPSHGLSAGKARLALGAALAVDPAPDGVRAWFDRLALAP